jgi:DNA-binding response OmpR family regulator
MPSVAIIDRDTAFLAVLANRIDRLGWKRRDLSPQVRTKTLYSMDADVLVVDVSILGARRWKWLAHLCEQRPELHVIVCSGPSTVGERICALRAGADDWLNKPCHPEELIARIEAVTGYHRPFLRHSLESLWLGELEIRPHQFQAFIRGDSLQLTRREYELIDALVCAEGEVVAREAVYEAIWQADMVLYDRSVDVLVHKVRRKLEEASPDWTYIHTHYRHGYRLAPEQSSATQELVRLPLMAPVPATLAA